MNLILLCKLNDIRDSLLNIRNVTNDIIDDLDFGYFATTDNIDAVTVLVNKRVRRYWLNRVDNNYCKLDWLINNIASDLDDVRAQSLYLDWFNNYISVDTFAEHNELSINNAHRLIDRGRALHNAITA